MRGIRAEKQGRMPTRVKVMTQTVFVDTAPNLHTPAPVEWLHAGPDGQPVEPHGHRAYGVYSEAEQRITLDEDLHFERKRETFLHENLHAVLSVTHLDSLIEGQAEGFSEHLVSTLSPALLAWMRDNPHAVAWLQEVQ